MYHVRLLENLIVWETDKAYLFRFPKSRWKFWASKKLIQWRGKSMIMLVFDDMTFKLISDAGSEKVIDVDEFLKRFGMDTSYDPLEDLKDGD